MQKIIDAEKSDLFDVLAHVAYAMPPVTRQVRATGAKAHIDASFNAKQRLFLEFVAWLHEARARAPTAASGRLNSNGYVTNQAKTRD